MTRRSIVWLCAREELLLATRSRWTQTFTVVFTAFALAVASSGYVLSGGHGFQDFARTGVSLVTLILLLVPLTAIVFGVTALTRDAGAAELLFSQPVPRRTILLGQVLGLWLALVGAETVGLGLAGLAVAFQSGVSGAGSFLAVAASAAVLTALFLGLAAATAAGDSSARRARHLGVGLVIWFVAVVLFDVAALGVASLLPSGLASRVLMIAAVLNPVDAIRTATLLIVEGNAAFGSATGAFLRFTGGPIAAACWLSASIAGWLVVSLGIGMVKLERADI